MPRRLSKLKINRTIACRNLPVHAMETELSEEAGGGRAGTQGPSLHPRAHPRGGQHPPWSKSGRAGQPGTPQGPHMGRRLGEGWGHHQMLLPVVQTRVRRPLHAQTGGLDAPPKSVLW